MHATNAPDPSSAGRARNRAHEHCILLVDDHGVVRRALGEALSVFGCRVVDVGSGEEACQALRSGLSPCLVFLDPGMAHGSAWLFPAMQLANRDFAAIPVAVLSAMDVSPGMAEALHVDEWLVKPPDIEAMVRLTVSYCRDGLGTPAAPETKA
jgi:CheY-like chemotaxis protein